jgi:enterochelin esterase-like enzyme
MHLDRPEDTIQECQGVLSKFIECDTARRRCTVKSIRFRVRFRDILLAKGYDVTYRETGGDHSFHRWRATLAEGLMALLRSDR